MGHRLVHVVNVQQPRRIGDDRMPAIEDAQLHQLVGRDILHELHADLFQRRTAKREVIFQHPLGEVLAEDGPAIGNAELLRQDRAFAVRGAGGDAVDHAVGKGHGLGDPVGEIRVRQPRQPHQRIAGDAPVMGDVVTAHDREGRHARLAALAQRGQDHAEHGARGLRVGGIGGNRRVGRIEPVLGVEEIAALGDRHRHDADIGRGHTRDGGGGIGGLHEVDHRADDMGFTAVGLLLDQGGEPVLRGQHITAPALAFQHPCPDNGPIAAEAPVEQPVEIHRLVRPVKIAHPEMQDAGRQLAAGVAGNGDAVDPGQVGKGKGHGHGVSSSSCRRRHYMSGQRCNRPRTRQGRWPCP